MSNPFETYGLKHLSPSTCARFTSCPAMFVLEKVLGRRTAVGTAAHRGSAAEYGVALALDGADLKEAQEQANAKFDTLAALSGDPRRDKHRESVAGMVEQGYLALKQYGKPSSAQKLVTRDVEGLAVPIIGYYDFAWDDLGLIVDLKTTDAVPSNIRASHARQGAFYAACMGGNWSARICYASGKKSANAQIENQAAHLTAMDAIALTIQRFLSLSTDPQELAGLVVPDVESFYFSDPMARQAAFEVWGI